MSTNTHIKEAVIAALDRDPRVKHPERVAVRVDEIGTVVLRGAVGTLAAKVAAARDAREVAGVFNVIVDDLRIHPSIGHRGPDDEVRAAALRRLIRDPRIRSTHIHVKVAHGHLTLTGYVRDQSESDAAEEDVVTLTGVVAVTNRIDIR